MRKIREVLRLRYEMELSAHQIAASCLTSRTAFAGYLKRAEKAGLRWPLPEGMDDARLERLLFPPPPCIPSSERHVPVWAEIHADLRLRLDREPSERPDHRTHRRRQDLDRPRWPTGRAWRDSVLYKRMPSFLRELAAAKNDGSYGRFITACAKSDLVVLDDWRLERLNHEQSLDLLEILEDRYSTRSTMVAAQLPVDKWHETVSDPTLADAIMDRIIHNAHRIEMKGGSLRMKNSDLTGQKEKE